MGHRFGVAWYGRRDWQVLRDAAVDPDELESSYDDWLRLCSASCAELSTDGIDVERIRVEADELLRWCREQNLPLDAQARARFASEKLYAQVDRNRCMPTPLKESRGSRH